jgi:hypothetical protein
MQGRVIWLGALVIVAFDIVASVASRTIGFPYSDAAVGSYVIYAVFGFAIGRRAGVGGASLGVAMIATVEATIGWALSWVIGPGRPPNGMPRFGALASTVALVAATGAVLGAMAGLLAKLLVSGSRKPPRSGVE